MANTREKTKYNQRTYATHVLRVRKDSDLADRIAGYKADGFSLNQLVMELLAAHFGTELPMKYYFERRVEPLVQGGRFILDIKHTFMEASVHDCHQCHCPFDESGDRKYKLPNGSELCIDCMEEYAVYL